jgi:hypothetical protein
MKSRLGANSQITAPLRMTALTIKTAMQDQAFDP